MPRDDARGRERGAWRGVVLAALLAGGCARSDEAWVRELESADPFARVVAALALSRQAPERASLAVEALLEAVDRSDLGLEEQAARALARVAPQVAEQLVTALVTDELMTQARRRVALGALAASGREGAETIVAALRGSGSALGAEVTGELGLALVRMGAPAVAPLAELLGEDREPRLTGLAAFVLGQLGATARAALPALHEARAHPDPTVRAAVEQALRRIEPGGPGARAPEGTRPSGGRGG